jgi:hypothetical protein
VKIDLPDYHISTTQYILTDFEISLVHDQHSRYLPLLVSTRYEYAGRDLERVEIDLYLKVLQTSHWSVFVGGTAHGTTRRAHCPWAAQD